jgi:predicted ATPase
MPVKGQNSSTHRPSAALTLSHLAVAGYRSLQQLTVPLGDAPQGGLTVVCGANGSGKSNLYRALGLIAAAARGELVAALAAEGGLPAVFWAGPERTTREMRRGEQPVQGSSGRREAARLRLGIAGASLAYAIELGYRADDHSSAFVLDPEIKREWIWAGGPLHPRSLLVRRSGAVVERCGEGGRSQPLALEVSPHESLLTAVSDPLEAPEVFQLRSMILSWRFYDSFRTDRQAPARSGRIATRTLSLAADGGDLAAAVQTIIEIGDHEGLQAAIAAAFPGCRL